ncbi:uncharacterized protein PHACADRAFT_206854 [Phanerochaete carnosa HHB-10118-sp]|uniref:N-acetyltransferase domain-containing protein n=1 Tax=Phanerochaete carnosa (strain HHB-10118-sp) TaxID=650164 RepID=K5V5Q5_PHACS|nr:uncharacterized protein PHACADRAFT_206854 [Phanerochaete carnosa HHB-10118-sp]EKM58011.1 hypothetical protein PHACADRAFT_206854 [Phanerochaete carnosa HHB-10118-sp]
MSQKSFFIRPAVVDDVDAILKLVVDHAAYLKAADQVKATPELLRKNFFETPYAHTLLAVVGSREAPGEVIGLAIYCHNFSTWLGKPGVSLGDIFVSEAYRSYGVGKAFFGELAKIAEAKDCARLDWGVMKWNQPTIDYYEKKLGASPMSEWMGMRLEGEGVANLKKFALQ